MLEIYLYGFLFTLGLVFGAVYKTRIDNDEIFTKDDVLYLPFAIIFWPIYLPIMVHDMTIHIKRLYKTNEKANS